MVSPDSSQMACGEEYGYQKARAGNLAVRPDPGRTVGPRLPIHASARIRRSSCRSRTRSAAGLPRRQTIHAVGLLSSGSLQVTSLAGLEARLTSLAGPSHYEASFFSEYHRGGAPGQGRRSVFITAARRPARPGRIRRTARCASRHTPVLGYDGPESVIYRERQSLTLRQPNRGSPRRGRWRVAHNAD
jgi:hypothetical protein